MADSAPLTSRYTLPEDVKNKIRILSKYSFRQIELDRIVYLTNEYVTMSSGHQLRIVIFTITKAMIIYSKSYNTKFYKILSITFYIASKVLILMHVYLFYISALHIHM